MAKGSNRQHAIRATEVWLIDQDGTDLGFLPSAQAQSVARSRGLDLVPLDDRSSPPRYTLDDAAARQADAARAARIARGASAPPKEIRLRVKTGAADLDTRRRNAAALLTDGHRVKLRVELEPAQRSDPAPARAIIDNLMRALREDGSPEGKPFNEKGAVAVVLAPR